MDEDIKALQDEEVEVLQSIYEGDEAFTVVKDKDQKHFQYKYGEDGTSKSFVLDIGWTDDYPNVCPTLSMDTFYNQHVIPSVKEEILEKVKAEAEQYLGMSMTYSLFEFVKEHLDELLNDQPDVIQEVTERVESVAIKDPEEGDHFNNISLRRYSVAVS